MCGILLEIVRSGAPEGPGVTAEFSEEQIEEILQQKKDVKLNCSATFSQLLPIVLERGPNYGRFQSFAAPNNARIDMFSSVLSLRAPFTAQPLVSDRFIVQFNGELYNEEIAGNDGEFILEKLLELNDVEAAVRQLDGEFALSVWDKVNNLVYFCRDSVGKRSLAFKYDQEHGGSLLVSSLQTASVENKEKFVDCVNGTIYRYDLSENTLTELPTSQRFEITDNVDLNYEKLPERLQQLDEQLTKSVRQRVLKIQPFHHDTASNTNLFSVLFSGGLDCTILAGICGRELPPGTVIDLLNVGFDNPRTGLRASEAPDRILAFNSWKSLSLKFPLIKFNLVEINIPFDVYSSARGKVIDLMYPKNTEMDLSIAIAFYFASKGEGVLNTFDTGTSTFSRAEHQVYKSQSKVLISGLGADELFGGYHKFSNIKEFKDLVPELNKQINNIYERNLMRDDKVMSSNGVEVRYPFLSESFIKFVVDEIEINYKVSKYLLREYSKYIGIDFVSQEPKRAIQFGAKSAKMLPNGNKHGTDLL